MLLVFDGTTGEYSIDLLADAASPFEGDFRVNVNLYNPDTGTTSCNPSFFNDNMNDFTSHPNSTLLTLTGTSPLLMEWQEGDRVATNTVPFGNPDCTSLFRSAVADLADPFARDFIADGPVFGIIERVDIFADGFESGDVSAWSETTLCSGCPVADFDFFVDGRMVTFLNMSTGTMPLFYSWSFGDAIVSTETNPVHWYATSGIYNVTLTAVNSLGSDSITKPVTVED